MRVLVDTSVWSLVLRRRADSLNHEEQQHADKWKDLVLKGEAVLLSLT